MTFIFLHNLYRYFLLLQVYGFFKGLAFPLAAVGLLNSIFFGVYGLTFRLLSTATNRVDKGVPYYRDIFIAGGFAGAVQAIPACPIELVKVRLQVQKGELKVKVKCHRMLLRCHECPVDSLDLINMVNKVLAVHLGVIV